MLTDNIIKKLKDNFLNFHEDNYVKIFVNIKGKSSPILLSFIHLKQLYIIKNHFKDFFIEIDNNLHLIDNYNTPHLISEAFTFFSMELEKKEGIKMRHEQMLLQSDDTKYSLGYVDRSIIHIFGLKASGIHLNAYVEKTDENGELKKYLWIAKRSSSKLHDPNKLDNLVAGAISLGFSAFETLQKEAQEEAGIPLNLIKNNDDALEKKCEIFNKSLAYKSMQYGGLRNDIVNIYSIKLPESFTPKAVDGEVEEFYLISAEEVLAILINDFDSFKYNSALVTLYFLYFNNYIKNQELNNFLTNLFKNLSI